MSARRFELLKAGLGPFVDREIQTAVKAQRTELVEDDADAELSTRCTDALDVAMPAASNGKM